MDWKLIMNFILLSFVAYIFAVLCYILARGVDNEHASKIYYKFSIGFTVVSIIFLIFKAIGVS